MVWPWHADEKHTFKKVIMRAAGTVPPSAGRGVRWGYRCPTSDLSFFLFEVPKKTPYKFKR
jgi:hypothetical protein